MSRIDQSKLLEECAGVELGDARVDRRLKRILTQLAKSPGDSFPEQMESDADQEALYRFLDNEKVTLERLLAGHHRQTLARMGRHSLVRVAHDTTQFVFEGDREGLGTVQGNQKGFLAHFALAVVADETREPLGIVGVRPFIHTHEHRDLTASQRNRRLREKPRAEKHSSRWEKLAIDVSADLPEGVEAIHLMDQEADDYAVFCALREKDVRFVIRVNPKRMTTKKTELVATSSARVIRSVFISARSKKQATRQHPERAERVTELSIEASTIRLNRPDWSPNAPLPQISLNVVHVFEASPPPGEEAIEWMLFTSEPTETSEDLEAIVDHYRARWVIEEYFKALKTGCAFEKRQLCSFDALVRALGLFVPMAWTLLALRKLGREMTNRPATDILTTNQLQLLGALLQKRRRRLAESPTIRDAMLGIAGLGGHIKNNGDPGWLVLGRGLRRFSEAEQGWNLAREM